jgi:phage terminase small subunit
MGKRGPQPTPTKILAARGSWRAKVRHDDLELPAGTPRKPAWLKGEAAKEWKRVTAELSKAGVLADIDQTALAQYCAYWAMWLEEYSATVPNPQLMKDYYTACTKLAREFGLTPSSRVGLKAEKPQKADDSKERFFKISS